uniref:SusC/RagA family TonB-linked outer membrane protein n=1 Tax=uncultured Muribaculaceae bacterium TaxID=2301481 RepID=A0A6G8F3M8_9BACT|nr:SusC/RagA family TonB-linked outer membrane protein [uncultured Muribaculaceae bacterium]
MALLLSLALPGFAQKIAVHGYVDDELGEPLIGATVMEKGTSNGTATDIDGNFTISVDPKAILVISYIGYDPMEVPVDGRTEIKITMKENATMLAETVVIGYGSVKKSDATGSVAIVKPDEVEAGLATSVQDMLVGQTPGVVVTTAGGPSGSANIRIRGGASLSATNDPLIVLDGVPLSQDTPLGMGSPLAMINPESIESMTVLKDASATAIYGSRASNGVIIITTKKGTAGKPKVTFAANFFVDYARKTQKVLNAADFSQLIVNKFGADSSAAGYLGDTSTDWQDQIYRTTFSSDYTLSISGTAGNLPYRVDGSFTNNNGIIKNSGMNRGTVGFTLTPRLFDDHLKINATAKGYYIRNNWSQDAAIGQAVSFNPTIPVHTYYPISGGTAAGEFQYLFNGYTEPFTVAGGTANLENNATYNPVATIEQTKNYSNVWRSNGNLQLDYSFHFLPELHANLNLGYDVTKSDDYYTAAPNSHMAWKDNENYGGGYSNHKYAFRSNTLLEFYLNYKKEFEAAKSMLDATAGYTWSRDAANGWNTGASSNTNIADTQGLSAAQMDPNGGYILNYNPSTADQVGKPFKKDDKDPDGNYHWKNHLQLLSFFGRVNYTFMDRYLFTATVRGDATSRFSKENRWGVFPAVALGWRIDQEEFMSRASGWLSDLKLRLGWGETGQQAVGSYYNYIPTVTPSQPGSYYPNGTGGWLIPFFPDGYNKNLKWETTTTWNVGLDFGFLNNRISGNIEWYLRKTRDLLSTVPVPAGSSTVNYLPQNIGDMENYGVEFNISAKPIVTDDFTWTLSYNIGWNHNEITNLDGNEFAVGGGGGVTGSNVQIQREGYPAYSFNLYQQVYDEAGRPIEGAYVDQNGDGVIDTHDLVVRYSKDPKVTMTFGSNFRYKKWDFGFNLRASIGNYVYADALRGGSLLDGLFRNNQLSNIYQTDQYFNVNQPYSDYWVRNASFLRCDNITLGYTFDNLLNDKMNLRLFAGVQNPFVITKYKGLDPEVFSGVDGNIYPRATTWSLGLVANF